VQSIYEQIWRGAECAACKLHDVCPGPLAELADELSVIRTPATAPRRKRSRR